VGAEAALEGAEEGEEELIRMKVFDLFSGIGGFSLGLEWAGGFETIRFCEKDEYCRRVLEKHWPGVPIVEDIHEFRSCEGEADVVVGGFPCQPFSQAGKRLAESDPRHLWPEMLRVIGECRPTWVIGENVAGLRTMGLDTVLTDLEDLGYSTRTFNIPALAVGTPHRRARLWIVAYAECGELRDESGRRYGTNREGAAESANHGKAQPLADTDCMGRQGKVDVYEFLEATERDAKERAAFEPPGFNWWDTEPDVGRVAHGVPSRVDRLRALGNAVVPQIVAEIGRAIQLSRKE
jgi:DNA (cytosine-5)-methyltransferase 1